MNKPDEIQGLIADLDRLMVQMIEQQRDKVVRVANRIQPGLSDDDLRDPHSFPAVSSRPEFAYEDGLLAGLIAGHVALMRDALQFLRERKSGEGN